MACGETAQQARRVHGHPGFYRSAAGVTIANGADNVSVYTSMFVTVGLAGSLITVAVWRLAGSGLGSHRTVVTVVQRFGQWIVPVVFMLIGAVIVIESGALRPGS